MDEFDKKIISILQDNGRASLSMIGKKLGISHVSVRKRLQRLCEGIVEISACLNAEKLGFRFAVVNAEVETHERLLELIDMFSECPRIVFMATTTGAYNIMTIMVAEDANTLNAITEVCSIRARKGIRRSEVTIAEAPVVPKCLPIKIVANKDLEVAPCKINCGECLRYKNQRCLGCPATKYYRGPL